MLAREQSPPYSIAMTTRRRMTMREALSAIGRRGARARAKALSKTQRKAIAAKAAKARWAKVRRPAK